MLRLCLYWMSLIAAGCSSALPSPAIGRHPQRAFIEVPYPPPAALVEVVPPAPSDTAVWVDGYWAWRSRYYVWVRGGWTQPAETATYATWQVVLADDGRLLFAPGAWYDDESHEEIPSPQMLVVARTPPNRITAESEAAR